jgi:hypothetical protein
MFLLVSALIMFRSDFGANFEYCHDSGVCDYRRGMDWILDLLTQLGTTSNYCVISNLHTLQFTAANTKSSPARSAINSRFLVMDVNSGDSSASRAQVLPARRISHN